jgi:hypothetical protein
MTSLLEAVSIIHFVMEFSKSFSNGEIVYGQLKISPFTLEVV